MSAQIVLENVEVRLPNRLLFEQVNFTLYEGMRVALAGRNGSGKSTLMRIMGGRAEASGGTCSVVGRRKLRMGFLDQSLLDRAASATQDSKLSAVELLGPRVAADIGDVEVSEIEWEIRKMLSGLGFSKEWMERPVSELSGGWLLRVFIAEALCKRPEVLLLDEPTNHLDISSIQWLEEFLSKEYQGSLVLITHDIALQRKTTDSIAVIHGGKFFFRKHQSDYLTFRESLGDEKRLIEKSIESLKKKIDENMEFVLKFRAKAQTAARAQSKLKMAETQQEEVNELKERLQRIEGTAYNMGFRFRHSGAGSRFPLSIADGAFRYSDDADWILKNITLDVTRGQRIAILGDNGAGKTTLLNVMAGRLVPQQGKVTTGSGVVTGYFGQHQLDELSLENTVLENLQSRAQGVSFEQLRGWLGAFGFSGNSEIDKKAKVLSGGERARLALLRILVTQINLCLLDEPTNHLDIETKELLKDAIRSFEGSVIFVSHDRDFVEGIAQRILYLTQDHQLIDHIGDLDSFFAKYPQFVRHTSEAKKPTAAPKEKSGDGPAVPQISYEERKKLKNQAKSLQKKIATAEADIDRISQQKTTVPADDFKKMADLDRSIQEKMMEWEKFTSELEAIRKQVPELV